MGNPNGLVQGTLDLLMLRTLTREPGRGWAITKRRSKEVLQVQQRYPALHRLEQQGWITAQWTESGTGPQAKGDRWKRLSRSINLVVSEA